MTQFTLPGVPLIYYGEEIGMEGGADPDCRRTMRWDRSQWNHAQRDWVRRLITIRQTSPALQVGEVTVWGDRLRGNALVFLRHTAVPGEEALVIVNNADEPLQVRLMLPYSHWYDGVPLRDALWAPRRTPRSRPPSRTPTTPTSSRATGCESTVNPSWGRSCNRPIG